MPASILLLLVGCALDTNLNPKPGEPFDPDLDETGTDTAPPVDTAPPGETGEACVLAPGEAGAVAIVEACEGGLPPVPDPWDVTMEWQYDVVGNGVITMPAVGHLTDDDGDGTIGAGDIPDIVFTTLADTLVALSGDGSGTIFEKRGFCGTCGVALADVDADGAPDVIAYPDAIHVAAVDATGRTKWTSPMVMGSSYPQPTVADVDGDGRPEVVTEGGLVNGEDGTMQVNFYGGSGKYTTPVAADLDRDGTMEIVVAERVLAPNGGTVWEPEQTFERSSFSAVANFDGDDDGEVVFVNRGGGAIHDADGTLLLGFSIPGGGEPGPPCVADFDGDGAAEIGVANNNRLTTFEVDGTQLWSAVMQDGSGIAGCSAFDIDADGAAEVLVADETAFRIYDGRLGTVRFEDGNHASNTLWEYPVVADVDGDGAAEIVTSENNGSWLGIAVWGHDDAAWPAVGTGWGVHDYAVSNVSDDGHVPSPPPAPWLDFNGFRARPTLGAAPLPDLVPSLADVCAVCEEGGTADLAIQVANEGGADAAAGLSLAVYASDGAVLATAVLPAVASGEKLAGITLSVDAARAAGGLRVVVDDDGTGVGGLAECEELDNVLAIEAPCP